VDVTEDEAASKGSVGGRTPTGGRSEPGHGWSRGPWRWTVLSLRCSCLTALQTAQTPLALLASCERAQ